MPGQPGGSSAWVKLLVAIIVLAVIGTAYYVYRDDLTLANLARHETRLRQLLDEHAVTTFAIAFAAYVIVTGLSLPFASVMTLAYGWLFGFLPALVLVSFASTSGATLSFLLARYLLRDTIQRRLGDRLKRFNSAVEREGAFYLFTLRLIAGVPFWTINLAMGLTPIRARTFWWVSQLGMLPGTCVYVWAGSAAPTLDQLATDGIRGIFDAKLIAAFALLGIFPILVKRVFARAR